MRHRPLVAAAVAIALVSASGRAMLGPEPVLAACPQSAHEYAGADTGTSVDADGAKMAWKARALTATDWALGGFASQVLWIGTNHSAPYVNWVEAGITQGWAGSNILTLYTAHGNSSGLYAEHRWTLPSVSIGSVYTLAGFYNTVNTYRTTVNANANSWDWSPHNSPTAEWQGGLESTCAPPSKVSNTYVSLNQYRRASDHVYVNSPGGSLFDNTLYGGSAWCSSPVTFRYWMNDSTTGCS